MENMNVRTVRRSRHPPGTTRTDLLAVDPNATAEQLELSTRTVGDTTVVRVGGELDLASRRRLHAHLRALRERPDRLVLDLAELTFIDSSGLDLLERVQAETGRRGGYFALAALQSRVARVLRVAGLAGKLPVYDTVSAAAREDAS